MRVRYWHCEMKFLKANKIVVCGAGRVGMAVRGFGMRLGHLGF
jgi:D-arabinose 5-phosphate isomerase GutQ